MKPTLVTVTYNTWDTYTERLCQMVEQFTNPSAIQDWIIVDNNSDDWEHLVNRKMALPCIKVHEEDNVGDIPRYNRVLPYLDCQYAIIISTDVRIWTYDWVEKFMEPFTDPSVAMVGKFGPGNMGPQHADPNIGGAWHWIPKLLTDRNIVFNDCSHIQTHFFAIDIDCFNAVGGFWEPESDYLIKGHLIAGEVSLGAKLTYAGYELSNAVPPHHHYGNQAASQRSLDEFDHANGWEAIK